MNSKIKIILASLLLVAFANSYAQKRALKIDDAYVNRAVYPASLRNLQWIPETNLYSWSIGDTLKVESVDLKTKLNLGIDVLNKAFASRGLAAQKRWPQAIWTAANTLEIIYNDSLYELSIGNSSLKLLNYFPASSEYIQQNDISKNVAFTIENNLYVSINGIKEQITFDTDGGIVNGQTVSRSEFGITQGIFWSPKGNLLAYYKKDETKVTNYPLVDIDKRVAEVKNTRYAMAGMASEKIDVCVYNVATKKTIQLKVGEYKEQYQTNISWSPDEKYIYISELNRLQNHMQLKKYDATTGDLVKVLFEEKNEKYVEPEDNLFFLNGSSDRFVFLSERDGFKHAYLYDTQGNLIKKLTSGKWMITDFMGFDAKNEKMYFMSTQESPIQRHLYELNIKKGSIKKLTGINGTHTAMLNSNKTYFLDSYSNSTGIAREYGLNDTKGTQIRIISKNVDPLSDFNLGETTLSTLKSNNGVDLYYRMIKPANFDPTKKYPVIVYVYGGPHAQMVTDSWLGGGGLSLQYLATQGFVIFTLDNQGSGDRGFEFESIIHRNLGVQEMKDQITGVNYLKSLSFVDTNRIGVDGWSYGGFMTVNLMLSNPGLFKVGVAGGPVIDWNLYEVMYGERYMDMPQENPEGYDNANLIKKAKKLQGKLLIIHGTMDPTVVWQHSLLFVQECVKNQKQVDYFAYPGHEHNVRGIDRLHLEIKIYEYFKQNL